VFNEPVGKVFLTSENDVFGDYLILLKYEIADCGVFYEVIFFCILPKNLLGDFFYSINWKAKGRSGLLPQPSAVCYVNTFIMCRARFSSISLWRGIGCFFTRFWIYVKVVSLAMSQENTSNGSDLFDKLFSLHTERVSSLTLCSSGTSSIVISM
jgi:hypothetical protein